MFNRDISIKETRNEETLSDYGTDIVEYLKILYFLVIFENFYRVLDVLLIILIKFQCCSFPLRPLFFQTRGRFIYKYFYYSKNLIFFRRKK